MQSTTPIPRTHALFAPTKFNKSAGARRNIRRQLKSAMPTGPNGIGFCSICEKPFTQKATIDHIIPRTRGGRNHISNYQLLCQLCNSKKANLLPCEYVVIHGRIYPLSKPIHVHKIPPRVRKAQVDVTPFVKFFTTVKEIIESGFCQTAIAVDYQEYPCSPVSASAERWSLNGAIIRAGHELGMNDGLPFMMAFDTIINMDIRSDVLLHPRKNKLTYWNNYVTEDDVIALIDSVIEWLENNWFTYKSLMAKPNN